MSRGQGRPDTPWGGAAGSPSDRGHAGPAVKRLEARSAEPRVQPQSHCQSLDRPAPSRVARVGACPHPTTRSPRWPPPPTASRPAASSPTSKAWPTGPARRSPTRRPAGQASAEINRLKHAKPSSRTERYVERKLIADQIATGPLDAARVRDDEIHGRGSSATWMHNREQEPPPVEDPGPAASRRRRAPVVGKRTELARYTVAEGERILYGQRIDGIVRVTDRPAGQGGRAYLVERGLETKSELDALIADYLQQAAKLDCPPLAVCPLESSLEASA